VSEGDRNDRKRLSLFMCLQRRVDADRGTVGGPERVSDLLNDKTHNARRSQLTGVSNAMTAMTLGHKSSSGYCLCACMRNTESAINNPPIL
jgi:hypothetical protein